MVLISLDILISYVCSARILFRAAWEILSRNVLSERYRPDQVRDFIRVMVDSRFVVQVEEIFHLFAVIGQDESAAGRYVEDALVDCADHLATRAVEVDFRLGVETRQFVVIVEAGEVPPVIVGTKECFPAGISDNKWGELEGAVYAVESVLASGFPGYQRLQSQTGLGRR